MMGINGRRGDVATLDGAQNLGSGRILANVKIARDAALESFPAKRNRSLALHKGGCLSVAADMQEGGKPRAYRSTKNSSSAAWPPAGVVVQICYRQARGFMTTFRAACS